MRLSYIFSIFLNMGHPHWLQVDSDGSPAGSLLAYIQEE